MARIRSINVLYRLLDEWETEVQSSPLSGSSKKDYIGFAQLFVRWCDEEFTPGQTIRSQGRNGHASGA